MCFQKADSTFRWQEVKDLLRSKVDGVSRVQLLKDGSGLVEFETVAAAAKTIEMFNHFEWKGRTLVFQKPELGHLVVKGDLGHLVEKTSMERAESIGKTALIFLAWTHELVEWEWGQRL